MSVLAASELSKEEQREIAESRSILDECADLIELAAMWNKSEYGRQQIERDARLAQAREDCDAGLPVRWCEHCVYEKKLCWFHRNHK